QAPSVDDDRFEDATTATSDATGHARFMKTQPGKYVMQARNGWHGSDLQRVDVGSGTAATPRLVVLDDVPTGELGPETVDQDGHALDGISYDVFLRSRYDEFGERPTDGFKGTTDARGQCNFRNLEPGLYWVSPRSDDKSFTAPQQALVYSGQRASLRFVK